MPMVGQETALVTSIAIGSTTPSTTMAKAPAWSSARASLTIFFASASLAPAGVVAAQHVDRLRGQPDMADHRDAPG